MSNNYKVKTSNNGDYEGRYTGNTPYQAAKKACTHKCVVNKPYTVSIKDTNTKKEFKYKVKKIKLTEPVIFNIGDREIKINHDVKVKRIKTNSKTKNK